MPPRNQKKPVAEGEVGSIAGQQAIDSLEAPSLVSPKTSGLCMANGIDSYASHEGGPSLCLPGTAPQQDQSDVNLMEVWRTRCPLPLHLLFPGIRYLRGGRAGPPRSEGRGRPPRRRSSTPSAGAARCDG